MKPWIIIVASVLAAAPLAAWAAGKVVVVDQNKLQFSMPEAVIKVGDQIRFTNSDRTSHNLMISLAGAPTNSGLQQPGEPFEMPFTRAGTYQVICGIHPKMQMKVVVQP